MNVIAAEHNGQSIVIFYDDDRASVMGAIQALNRYSAEGIIANEQRRHLVRQVVERWGVEAGIAN